MGMLSLNNFESLDENWTIKAVSSYNGEILVTNLVVKHKDTKQSYTIAHVTKDYFKWSGTIQFILEQLGIPEDTPLLMKLRQRATDAYSISLLENLA